MSDISIAEEDPRAGDIAAMIGELDQYLSDLYPAESNHLMGLESLAADNVVFLVARQDGKAVGCVALVREAPDWAEVKRIYVRPVARGAGVGGAMLGAVESAGRGMGLQWLREGRVCAPWPVRCLSFRRPMEHLHGKGVVLAFPPPPI